MTKCYRCDYLPKLRRVLVRRYAIFNLGSVKFCLIDMSNLFSTRSAHQCNENKISSISSSVQQQQIVVNQSKKNNNENYHSPYVNFFKSINHRETFLGTKNSQLQPTTSSTSPRLKCGILESVLRFYTIHYGRLILPPYVQQKEYNVMLKVPLRFIFAPGLLETDLERTIFHQIVGCRYIIEKDELRLNCNLFSSRIENKRHVCSMLDRIIISAKKLAMELQNNNVG